MTRRQLVRASSTFALATALAGGGFEFFTCGHEALAQAVADADLMQAGPLGDVALGDEKAPVTIIEYASMTCGHCGQFAIAALPQLKEKYIDTGKARYILREFPLDTLALGAAMLARCAGNDKYHAVVDLLLRTQNTWMGEHPIERLTTTLKQAGFTAESVKACLANQKVLDGIQAVRDHAVDKLGVNSTPTFFINGKKFIGDLSIDQMAKEIDPYLKEG